MASDKNNDSETGKFYTGPQTDAMDVYLNNAGYIVSKQVVLNKSNQNTNSRPNTQLQDRAPSLTVGFQNTKTK